MRSSHYQLNRFLIKALVVVMLVTLSSSALAEPAVPPADNQTADPAPTKTTAEFIQLLRAKNEALRDADRQWVDDANENDDVVSRTCDSTRISNITAGGGEASKSETEGTSPVPVFENGYLLEVVGDIDKQLYGILDGTRSIDKNTMQIKDISVDICYFLKSIRRIQTDFQYKEFVDDPAARRNAAAKVSDYGSNLNNVIGNGRDINGDGVGDESLFVPNLPRGRQQVVQAAKAGFDEELAASGNLYSNEIRTAFAIEDAQSFTENLASDMSADEVNALTTDPRSLTPNQFWDYLTRFYNGSNDIYNSYDTARSFRNTRAKIAEQDFMTQYIVGKGYLPYSKCVQQTQDENYCLQYLDVTPGATVADLYHDSLNSKLTQAEQADQAGEDVIPGMSPTIGNVINPESRDAQYPVDNETDQPLTPNPVTDTFEPASRLTIKLQSSVTNPEAVGAKNIDLKLTTNADSCKAGNDWTSMASDGTSLTTVYKTDDEISPNSTKSVRYPLTFELKFYRTRGGLRQDITLASTSDAIQEYSVKLPTDLARDIQIGDSYTLALPNFDSNHTFSTTISAPTSASAILNSIYRLLIISTTADLTNYTAQAMGEGFRIGAKNIYTVSCTKGTQQKKASTIIDSL